MVEFFEHTADVGMRVEAAALEDVLAEAAQALFARMVAWPERIELREHRSLVVRGAESEPAYLLLDWLGELLYLFESEGWVGGRVTVRLAPGELHGELEGEPLVPEKHGKGNEVKAITYHGLRVERQGGVWLAEVILDI